MDGHATSGASEEASGQDGSADAIPLGERTDVSRFSAHGCRVWRVSEAKDRGGARVVGGRRGLAGSDPSSFFARWSHCLLGWTRAVPFSLATLARPDLSSPNHQPTQPVSGSPTDSHLRPRPPSRPSSSLSSVSPSPPPLLASPPAPPALHSQATPPARNPVQRPIAFPLSSHHAAQALGKSDHGRQNDAED